MKPVNGKSAGAGEPRISVVTPSRNMLPYLRRCCRSVADQAVAHEHIVMDAASDDGTREWLAASGLTHVSERDRGMYDALNKGLAMARGEICAYLNCDEQYLPGTLEYVDRFFRDNPGVDVLVGGALLVDGDGRLLSFRKAYPLRWSWVAVSHLYCLSCALFFRRRVLDAGLWFDPSFRASGDQDFVIRVLRAGFRSAHVARYLAAFTVTGQNLSNGDLGRRESDAILARAGVALPLRAPLNAGRLATKLVSGAYRQRLPLEYDLYLDGAQRVRTRATRASQRWPW